MLTKRVCTRAPTAASEASVASAIEAGRSKCDREGILLMDFLASRMHLVWDLSFLQICKRLH